MTPSSSQTGGKSLAISSDASGVQLTWSPGTAQTGYLLVRAVGSSFTTTFLPASATTYLDQAAPPGRDCYVLVALGTTPTGVSDYVCAMAGLHSATGGPAAFTRRLNQSSTASFAWGPPVGTAPDVYILASLGGGQVQYLGGSANSATASPAGLTCYVLVAMRNNVLVGYADPVCGLPGISNLGP
jgi:hypothetical protein